MGTSATVLLARGRVVTVTGRIKLHKGRPEIVLESPSQVTEQGEVIGLNGRMLRLAVVALSIFSVFTASCVSASKQMNDMMASWVGSCQQDLINKWGPPTYTTSDGGDGTILVYEQQRTRTSLGDFSPSFSPNPLFSQTQTKFVKRMFYVNSQRVIYSWRWEGM